MKVKPRRVARLAERMGIRTKLTTNPAMLLGGLREGVTPLEMAYAYSTIANDGVRVSGSLAPQETGPVAIQEVDDGDGKVVDKNEKREQRVLPAKVAQVEKDMLGLVVSSGTGKAAQVGDEFIWGKTGTTENYGDAWFVGGNDDITVAIWVGYADKLQPMEYEHAGGPVAGGTFPAEIFHDFMTSWLELRGARRAERRANKAADESTDGTTTPLPVAPTGVPPTETVPAVPETGGQQDQGDGGGGGTGGGGQDQPAPQNPAPAPEPAPTPAPAPTQPPSGGEGGGGGVSPEGDGTG
jgi:penicillin-binding protein 1A